MGITCLLMSQGDQWVVFFEEEEEEACGKLVKLYTSAFHLCFTEVIHVKNIYSYAEIKLAPSAVSHR